MTRLASTSWASVALGLAFTSAALAQTAPDPNAPDIPPEPTPMEQQEPMAPPPQPESDVDVDVNVDQPPPTTDYTVPPMTDYETQVAEEEGGLLSGIGIAIAAGGGASGFTNDAMRDTTDIGGDWDVRLTFGTRSPLAFEASYIGSAQSIDALGLDDDAILVGNGLQGAVRLNATVESTVQPFLYAGLGWRRYDLTNVDVNLSDVRGDDNVLEIPLGIGVAGRWSGLIVDLRGEFRATTNGDLVPEFTAESIALGEEDFASMHRWGVKATVGYEF